MMMTRTVKYNKPIYFNYIIRFECTYPMHSHKYSTSYGFEQVYSLLGSEDQPKMHQSLNDSYILGMTVFTSLREEMIEYFGINMASLFEPKNAGGWLGY
jgi:hypothetical protein